LENTTFVLRSSWYSSPLPVSDDFFGPDTRIEATLDGTPVTMTSKDVIVNDAAIRYFQAIYLGGLSDTHTFVLLSPKKLVALSCGGLSLLEI